MPLIQKKSKKALQENIDTEMEAHPEKDRQAQNLAIAYNIQRKNKKKMADGGQVEDVSSTMRGQDKLGQTGPITASDNKRAKQIADQFNPPVKKAYGGEISEEKQLDIEPVSDEEADEKELDIQPASDDEVEHDGSTADAIMRHRDKLKAGLVKMADGGMVELDQNAEEDENNLDDLNFEALKKENYSEEAAIQHDQPMDSNEHEDILSDEDANDMIEQIRRKLLHKRGA